MPLVLHSCSMGAEKFNGDPSFARTLSNYLPTNPIYSATAPFCYVNIYSKGHLYFKTQFKKDVLQAYKNGKKCPRQSVLRVN